MGKPTTTPANQKTFTGQDLQRDRRLAGLVASWLASHRFTLDDLVRMFHDRALVESAALQAFRSHPQHPESVAAEALEKIEQAVGSHLDDPAKALEAGLAVHKQLEVAAASAHGMHQEGLHRALAAADVLVVIQTLAGEV
jgi:hypothetical protein